jgi:hypothetical protein
VRAVLARPRSPVQPAAPDAACHRRIRSSHAAVWKRPVAISGAVAAASCPAGRRESTQGP